MAGDLQRLALTRRRVLLGATAIAANALAAACGSNVPVTPAPTAIPAAGTRLASNLPTTTVPTEAAAPLPAPLATVSTTFATPTGTPTTPLIVFAGGLRSFADSTAQPTETLPAQTIALLAPAKYDAVFLGVNADTLGGLTNRTPTTIDPLYAASRTKNILVVAGGWNELYYGASVAETFVRIVTYGQARRRVGWKVVWLTLLPWGKNQWRAGEDFESDRQAVNALMRQNRSSFADALADVGADPTIGTMGATADPAYMSAGLYSTVLAHSIMAPIVKAAILTL